MSMAPPLTAAQERFAIEYAATGNQTAAARAAYPAVAADTDAASERGRQLLRKPHVLARVAELRGQPLQPPDTSELERVASVVFDDSATDIVRLIALRALSAGLDRWRERYRGSDTASQIVVRISIEQTGPTQPRVRKTN